MSFEAPRTIGLIEKASGIALKYGIVYSATERRFKGPEYTVAKATAELKKWEDIETSRRFRDQRQTF